MDTFIGPFAWYVRRSDSKSDLDRQRKLLSDWCASNTITVPDLYRYEDTGSRDLSDKRPNFQRLIKDAQAKRFKTILVASFDRFGMEDTDEAGHYRRVLNKSGVILYSIEPDEGDLTAKDQATIIKLFFKAEASRIEQQKKGSRSITGKASQLQKAHSFMGGAVPYGYDKKCVTATGELLWTLHYLTPGKRVAHMPDGTHRNFFGDKNSHPVKARSDRVILVPSRDTTRIDAIKTMFDLWTRFDLSILTVCKRLNGSGHRHYGDLWKAHTVRGILANEVYAGSVVYNRRKHGRFAASENGREVHHAYKDKHTKYKRDVSKWIVIPNTHEPLIERKAFDKSTAKLTALERTKTIAPRHADLWLRRFAFCGHCGQQMHARHVGGHPYLICGVRKREVSIGATPTCQFNSVRAEVLEKQVAEHFRDLFAKLKDGDRETVAKLEAKIDTELGFYRDKWLKMEEELVPLAVRFGLPLDEDRLLIETIREASRDREEVRHAQAEFFFSRDNRIKEELATKKAEHVSITEKWATASGPQAPILKKMCDRLETDIADLEGQIFERWTADIRQRIAAIDQLKLSLGSISDRMKTADGTAKSEALREVLGRLNVHFALKSGPKAKSRV
ncbi:hypothetical protein PX52LOC_02741 [Limnoglobus roseus]|uniref:Recombinase family protein n=1 Tax=Limnoglobus roseus TaxID=2598579 RepID=A0A5C1AB52_9BACT|nr:hypothetical protein PX52LOC_02741 [Limnoglobus roseus]